MEIHPDEFLEKREEQLYEMREAQREQAINDLADEKYDSLDCWSLLGHMENCDIKLLETFVELLKSKDDHAAMRLLRTGIKMQLRKEATEEVE